MPAQRQPLVFRGFSPGTPSLSLFFIVLLVCCSGCLWWLLSRAQHQNAELQAEIVKLRGRLRALRQ